MLTDITLDVDALVTEFSQLICQIFICCHVLLLPPTKQGITVFVDIDDIKTNPARADRPFDRSRGLPLSTHHREELLAIT